MFVRHGKTKHVNILRLVMLIVFTATLLCSIPMWSFIESITVTDYRLLVGANYDIFILLSLKPLLSIMVMLGLFLLFNGLWHRHHGEGYNRGLTIFPLIMILSSSLTSVIMANYPCVIHRDVYLHGGVSEHTVINGKYDPIILSRNDAYVSPQTFILYSIYSMITSINVISLQTIMTILYPALLVMFLYVLTDGINIPIPKIKALPVLIVAFPTLITHTVGVTLFHRYYMSLLIMFCVLSVIKKGAAFNMSDVTIATILLISLQFTHPITSFFILLFIVAHYIFTSALLRRATINITWIALVIFFLYIMYLYPANMIREAFEWLFSVDKLLKFIETSYPIRIEIPQIYEEHTLLYYMSYCVKWMWRATLMLIAVIFLMLFIINRKRVGLLLSRHWFSLLASATIITLPTIASFLWQMRALPYFGVAVITLMREEFERINKDKLLRTLCIILVVFSLITPPIIHYERSYLSEMWNPPSLVHSLGIINSLLSRENAIYGGTKTSIYYTYYSNIYESNKMISIYEPILVMFRPDVFESAIGKPVVLSIVDPEYANLVMRLTYHGSSIVYSSNTVSVYIMIS